MTPSPDPVADPRGYQEHLLSLLADDDPATAQESTPAELRELIAEAGRELRTRPEASEWSVLECVAHIVDAELVASGRYRWILSHDEPDLPGYDQDLWVDRLHQPSEGPDELLTLFDALRRANLALWRRTPVEDRDRFGIHRERGPESFALTFQLIAGHDRFHIGQARRTLGRLRSG